MMNINRSFVLAALLALSANASFVMLRQGAEGSGSDFKGLGNRLTIDQCSTSCTAQGYPFFSYANVNTRDSLRCTDEEHCACYCYSSSVPTPHASYNLYESDQAPFELLQGGAEGSGSDFKGLGNRLTIDQCSTSCTDQGYPFFSYANVNTRDSLRCTDDKHCACYCYSSSFPTPHGSYNLYASESSFTLLQRGAEGSGSDFKGLGNKLTIDQCSISCTVQGYPFFSYANVNTSDNLRCTDEKHCACYCYSSSVPTSHASYNLYSSHRH